MCQCMICECWWVNYCGVCCAGVAAFGCCYSYWCCKHESLVPFDKECCHCCDGFAGWGNNCFCQGGVCCAPDYLKKWSVFQTTGAIGNGPMPNMNSQMNQGYPNQQQQYPQGGGYNPGQQYGGQPGGPTRIVINH